MCVAERAKIELMTKSYPKAASKKLERECEPREGRLAGFHWYLRRNLLYP